MDLVYETLIDNNKIIVVYIAVTKAERQVGNPLDNADPESYSGWEEIEYVVDAVDIFDCDNRLVSTIIAKDAHIQLGIDEKKLYSWVRQQLIELGEQD